MIQLNIEGNANKTGTSIAQIAYLDILHINSKGLITRGEINCTNSYLIEL